MSKDMCAIPIDKVKHYNSLKDDFRKLELMKNDQISADTCFFKTSEFKDIIGPILKDHPMCYNDEDTIN